MPHVLVVVSSVLILLVVVSSSELKQHCLAKHNIGKSDAFGISIVQLPSDASLPALSKRLCATASPAVLVQYRGVELNVLNMTASRTQCLALYTLFACQPDYPYASTVDCGFASQLSYAFVQSLPECVSDHDCRAPAKPPFPLIHCNWANDIRAEVCPRSTLPLQCVSELHSSFSLDGDKACALTSSLCASLITYTNLIATIAAATYVMCIAVVIYTCSAYRKSTDVATVVHITTAEIVPNT